MKRRSFFSYVILLAVFLMIAMWINGSTTTVSKRIEYPRLLQMMEADQVKSVAIRSNALVGLKRDSIIRESDFPERNYDFETTIGTDFLETARQMTAEKQGKALTEISVKDLPFDVQYRAPQQVNWFVQMLPSLLMTLVMMVFMFILLRSMMGGGNKMSNFGKANTRKQDPSKNQITFADVAGADEEKEELQEMVDFLRNPKQYIDLGARIPKGVLLVGPPGTGKTLLAKAVAGEAGVPFFSISGSDFVEMFVGVGASRVRDLFDQAKKSAPSIVFIDEIDAVGRHRGAGMGGGHDEREQTLNQLLVEMDGFSVNEGVIVMAATNRRDILDPALLRPGRFDRQVTVHYPDQEGRVAVLKVHCKGKPLAADVDLDNIAKRLPFSAGADLENVMNEAAILAARARKTEISQQILIEAIDRVQMGPEKKSHKVSDRDKYMVSVHESGHALVGHMLPGCDEVHLITIVPRGQSAGHTLSLPTEEHDNMSRSQMMDTISMILGGHAAEEVILGEIYTGSSSDLKRATELCRRMVTEFGMSDKLSVLYTSGEHEVFVGMEYGQGRAYSEEVAAEIDAEVRRILTVCYEKAKETIRQNKDKMDAVVKALIDQLTVSRKEFVSLMETGLLPEKEETPAQTASAEEAPTEGADDKAMQETPEEDLHDEA